MSAEKCQELLNTLLDYSCAPEFSDQMSIARELFAIATGKVNDDDPFYDSRMCSFQEYFLFDYRLSDVFSGSTVLELYLLQSQSRLSPEELNDFEQFRSFRHSLFLVEKVLAQSLIVTDLIAQQRFEVFSLSEFMFAGFEAGLVFEGRSISFNGSDYFTGAFIIHPEDVRGRIEKYVKQFLYSGIHCNAQHTADWRAELTRRHALLSSVSEQKRVAENADKKRAIDMLKANKQLVSVSRIVSSPHLVMAIGRQEQVSPSVPETSFYDAVPLIHKLAYCEMKSYRYKHIGPEKVYTLENDDQGKMMLAPSLNHPTSEPPAVIPSSGKAM
ncbi:MAG: hypothetical protein EBR09_06320 [Proteobacteria bacterium]|nr:hypothetical protein [Pseudomonadota bacterium]